MENVRTENRDGVCIITIDRPKVLNALNAQTVGEIGQAFEQARMDEAVKAVIVTGGGEKAFVAGADIRELATMTPITGKEAAERGQRIFQSIATFPKPVIAALNGLSLGRGCQLALARLLGKGKALELICTGDRIGAAEAEKIGLVNRVVPADQLMATAEEMARKIASRGPLAVRAAIEAVMVGSDMGFDEGQVLEATLFGLLASTDDMKEGMAAFLEKRAAAFSGC